MKNTSVVSKYKVDPNWIVIYYTCWNKSYFPCSNSVIYGLIFYWYEHEILVFKRNIFVVKYFSLFKNVKTCHFMLITTFMPQAIRSVNKNHPFFYVCDLFYLFVCKAYRGNIKLPIKPASCLL
jgi:hypothetical protein